MSNNSILYGALCQKKKQKNPIKNETRVLEKHGSHSIAAILLHTHTHTHMEVHTSLLDTKSRLTS